MRWQKWLIDIPAAIVTGWFAVYRVLLVVLVMVSVTMVFASLARAALGFGWDW